MNRPFQFNEGSDKRRESEKKTEGIERQLEKKSFESVEKEKKSEPKGFKEYVEAKEQNQKQIERSKQEKGDNGLKPNRIEESLKKSEAEKGKLENPKPGEIEKETKPNNFKAFLEAEKGKDRKEAAGKPIENHQERLESDGKNKENEAQQMAAKGLNHQEIAGSRIDADMEKADSVENLEAKDVQAEEQLEVQLEVEESKIETVPEQEKSVETNEEEVTQIVETASQTETMDSEIETDLIENPEEKVSGLEEQTSQLETTETKIETDLVETPEEKGSGLEEQTSQLETTETKIEIDQGENLEEQAAQIEEVKDLETTDLQIETFQEKPEPLDIHEEKEQRTEEQLEGKHETEESQIEADQEQEKLVVETHEEKVPDIAATASQLKVAESKIERDKVENPEEQPAQIEEVKDLEAADLQIETLQEKPEQVDIHEEKELKTDEQSEAHFEAEETIIESTQEQETAVAVENEIAEAKEPFIEVHPLEQEYDLSVFQEDKWKEYDIETRKELLIDYQNELSKQLGIESKSDQTDTQIVNIAFSKLNNEHFTDYHQGLNRITVNELNLDHVNQVMHDLTRDTYHAYQFQEMHHFYKGEASDPKAEEWDASFFSNIEKVAMNDYRKKAFHEDANHFADKFVNQLHENEREDKPSTLKEYETSNEIELLSPETEKAETVESKNVDEVKLDEVDNNQDMNETKQKLYPELQNVIAHPEHQTHLSFYEQAIRRGFDEFRNDAKNWHELTDHDKEESLQKFSEYTGSMLTIKNQPPINFEFLEDRVLGQYDPKTHEITVNKLHLDDPVGTAVTIAHELRHAKQMEVVHQVDKARKYSLFKSRGKLHQDLLIANPDLFSATFWKENALDYKTATRDGYEVYKNQPLEVDAVSYEKMIREFIEPQEKIVETIKISETKEAPLKVDEIQSNLAEMFKRTKVAEQNWSDVPLEDKERAIKDVYEEACRHYGVVDAAELSYGRIGEVIDKDDKTQIVVGKFDDEKNRYQIDSSILFVTDSPTCIEKISELVQEVKKRGEAAEEAQIHNLKTDLMNYMRRDLRKGEALPGRYSLDRWEQYTNFDKFHAFSDLWNECKGMEKFPTKYKFSTKPFEGGSNFKYDGDQDLIHFHIGLIKERQTVEEAISYGIAKAKVQQTKSELIENRYKTYVQEREAENHKKNPSLLDQPNRIIESDELSSREEWEQIYGNYMIDKADFYGLTASVWNAKDLQQRKQESIDFLRGISAEQSLDFTYKIEFTNRPLTDENGDHVDVIFEKNRKPAKPGTVYLNEDLLTDSRENLFNIAAKGLSFAKIESEKQEFEKRTSQVQFIQSHYKEQMEYELMYNEILQEDGNLYIENWDTYSSIDKQKAAEHLFYYSCKEPGVKEVPFIIFESSADGRTLDYNEFEQVVRVDPALLENAETMIEAISYSVARVHEDQAKRVEAGTELFQTKPSLEELEEISSIVWKEGSSFKHILEGEVHGNKAKGLHYLGVDRISFFGEIVEDGAGNKLIKDLDPDTGIYEATIQINGVTKNKESTMFPDDWTLEKVITSVNEAYRSARYSGEGNKWIGKNKENDEIIVCLDDHYRIITAWPNK